MKNKKISLLLFVFIVFFIPKFIIAQNPSEDFNGGSGTSADPYKIINSVQLSNIRNYLGTENAGLYFKIMNDIDLSEEAWIPIATSTNNAFHGKLNGCGKKLIGLNIGSNGSDTHKASGLFGYVKSGAVIDSVNLVGGYIRVFDTGSSYTGSIAGYIDLGIIVGLEPNIVTISNCSSSVNIESNSTYADEIGGIAGRTLCFAPYVMTANFINCYFSGSISSIDDSKVGGILGLNSSFDNGTITLNFIECGNSADITTTGSTILAGGLLGSLFSEGPITINIEKCYNTGNITGGEGDSYTSGLVAFGSVFGGSQLSMSDCYSNSTITAVSNSAGGLVGLLRTLDHTSSIILENCYTAGNITGSAKNVGGLIGELDNPVSTYTIKNCVAAQFTLSHDTYDFHANRLVGKNENGSFINNYANSDMKINGITQSSSDPNSIFGMDKPLFDLFNISTYNTEQFSWDISTGNNSIWNINNIRSLPYFPRQSSPVYVSDLFRDSIIFELNNLSDSLKLIRQSDNNLITSYSNLSNQNFEFEIDLRNMNSDDIVTFINYETNKEASNKVYSKIQRRNVYIAAQNAEKCFGDDDPELNYIINSTLLEGDIITGQLSRHEGENGGTYAILQGTVNNENNINYNIIFAPALFKINQIDISVSSENNILTANNSTSATYQWLNCSNNYTPIEDATEQSFTTPAQGNFAVEITQNNCTDTSECHPLNFTEITNHITNPEIQLYPNPTNGKFFINLNENFEKVDIDIFTYDGKLLEKYTNIAGPTIEYCLPNISGVYYISVTDSKNHKKTFKVINSEN
ncbi:MAG: T9SS type A sorting domain-containing protein [Bacteroidales bacterium]|jgi:hypothetical protein|nr:T9SS type A sorting domain-containing protein [Bacteroidales bacterium]